MIYEAETEDLSHVALCFDNKYLSWYMTIDPLIGSTAACYLLS